MSVAALHLMMDIVQSCVDTIMRVDDTSIIPLDFTQAELVVKSDEDAPPVEKPLTVGILLLNQKTNNTICWGG
jgi:hypothetical protein